MVEHVQSTCKLTSATDDILIIYKDNIACTNHLKLSFIKDDATKHIVPKFFSHEPL